MKSFKNFLFKINNDTVFFWKTFLSVSAVIFLIITIVFVKFTFFVDYSNECNEMESFVTENKENICNLINLYDTGEVDLYDSDYTIKFDQDEVYISTPIHNIFADRLKIRALVDKDNNNVNFIIDKNYVHTNVALAFFFYFLLLFVSFVIEIEICFLLKLLYDKIINKKCDDEDENKEENEEYVNDIY